MNKREQKFTTECKKWCIHNVKTLGIKKREAAIIECKVSVDNKPLNIKSGFQDHQIPDLISMNSSVWGFKPSDAARSYQIGDLIIGNCTETYVIMMWIRRGNKRFYILKPKTIQELIDEGRKSIDEKTCAILADITGILK